MTITETQIFKAIVILFSTVSYIYDVSLTTGKAFGAGTDANIFIRLIGERGSSDELSIQTKKCDLEKGMWVYFEYIYL